MEVQDQIAKFGEFIEETYKEKIILQLKKDEKFFRPVLDIPRNENSCEENKTGEKDEGKADSICPNVKIDAEFRNPGSFEEVLHSPHP